MTGQQASNSVNAKVSYLCAGILKEKSAFSPATVFFEKIRLIPMKS